MENPRAQLRWSCHRWEVTQGRSPGRPTLGSEAESRWDSGRGPACVRFVPPDRVNEALPPGAEGGLEPGPPEDCSRSPSFPPGTQKPRPFSSSADPPGMDLRLTPRLPPDSAAQSLPANRGETAERHRRKSPPSRLESSLARSPSLGDMDGASADGWSRGLRSSPETGSPSTNDSWVAVRRRKRSEALATDGHESNQSARNPMRDIDIGSASSTVPPRFRSMRERS